MFYLDPDRKEPPQIILQFQSDPCAGISEEDIDDLYHELIHYFCYLNQITDHAGDNYHTFDFKQVVENHGGTCTYTDKINGYNDTTLGTENLMRIFEEI